jgi:hypothetical protein
VTACKSTALIGRMVVPVMVVTFTRSVTFTRRGDVWTGENPVVCGFVPLQGSGTGWDQQAQLGGGTVHLNVEGGPALDVNALDRALAGDRTETWTGTDTLNMHLAVTDDRAGNIWTSPGCDLVKMAIPPSSPDAGFCQMRPRRLVRDAVWLMRVRAVAELWCSWLCGIAGFRGGTGGRKLGWLLVQLAGGCGGAGVRVAGYRYDDAASGADVQRLPGRQGQLSR